MTTVLPASLTDGLGVRRVRPVSGGDIASAYRLDTAGGPAFLKTHPAPQPGMFEREAAGLRALRATGTVHVPEVLRASPDGLVLQWVDEGPRLPRAEAAFGAELAALHRTTGMRFGGLDADLASPTGYLGSQPVDLTPTPRWEEFLLERRLRPLTARAVRLGRLDPSAPGLLDRAAGRLDQLCGPPEPPTLLHGDLWAGNRIVDCDAVSWVIDPAVYWGHREVDLAMMALFGGFGPACFTAYQQVHPLAPGWQDRVEWYQLTPLLVHAILFAGGYGAAALRVLRAAAR
ncbi:MAG TPA: fructosamine kinase family protein [Dermatophilaceae bacterium]|nr:fructosamine kinase family protein [Dermatophilaceae bacterium]